jgi:hypothetical protein
MPAMGKGSENGCGGDLIGFGCAQDAILTALGTNQSSQAFPHTWTYACEAVPDCVAAKVGVQHITIVVCLIHEVIQAGLQGGQLLEGRWVCDGFSRAVST